MFNVWKNWLILFFDIENIKVYNLLILNHLNLIQVHLEFSIGKSKYCYTLLTRLCHKAKLIVLMKCFIDILFFKIVVLTFLYAEQDVNLALQSCSDIKNLKTALKNVTKSGKKLFCRREGMG